MMSAVVYMQAYAQNPQDLWALCTLFEKTIPYIPACNA